MAQNLLGADVTLARARYDEALKMQGIPAKYQYPNDVTYNAQGEAVTDAYTIPQDTYIFFEGNPKITTFKRLGWVVENGKDLPFLLHCSWNLPHVQKDSLFSVSGQYTDVSERVFRVTEITYDMQAPDHLICQVVPEYSEQTVHRTEKETRQQYHSSHTFIKSHTDYRGNYHSTKEDIQD